MTGPKKYNPLSTKCISYDTLIRKAALLDLITDGTPEGAYFIDLITDCFNVDSKKVEADLDAATEAFKKEADEF